MPTMDERHVVFSAVWFPAAYDDLRVIGVTGVMPYLPYNAYSLYACAIKALHTVSSHGLLRIINA